MSSQCDSKRNSYNSAASERSTDASHPNTRTRRSTDVRGALYSYYAASLSTLSLSKLKSSESRPHFWTRRNDSRATLTSGPAESMDDDDWSAWGKPPSRKQRNARFH